MASIRIHPVFMLCIYIFAIPSFCFAVKWISQFFYMAPQQNWFTLQMTVSVYILLLLYVFLQSSQKLWLVVQVASLSFVYYNEMFFPFIISLCLIILLISAMVATIVSCYFQFIQEELINFLATTNKSNKEGDAPVVEKNEDGEKIRNSSSSIPLEKLSIAEKEGELLILREELMKIKRAKECSVCIDKHCDTVFIPCGHVVTCSSCTMRLIKNECPLCRQKIMIHWKIFLPS